MRPLPRWLPALVALACTLTLAIAAPSGATPKGSSFSVTLADGHFTFTKAPTTIVSLSPTGTEMLYAIGAGHQVKAVDSDSDYPPKAPITKLSAYSPNVEAIAKYHPDLVLVSEDPTSFNTQMAALKIPVVFLTGPPNMAGAYAQYQLLGKITRHVAKARREVASIKSTIARVVASTPKLPAGSTYYYELDPTYYSATSSTFVGRLLAKLGLHSIADAAKGAAASGGYPQLSAEYILKANPTFIFLADTLCCKASATTVAKRPGWSALGAVKDDRVVALNDDVASRWGPRVTILLRDVAAAITRAQVPAVVTATTSPTSSQRARVRATS